MTSDSSFLLIKIRRLSQALLISGTLNIFMLVLLFYWVVSERSLAPYFELKPVVDEHPLPLMNQLNFSDVVTRLSLLSFDQLVDKLDQTQLIDEGYAERDLALSCLVAFHHFDMIRALPKRGQPIQQRILRWKNPLTGESVTLPIYPGLTEEQFKSIIAFARTEQWPMTSEGLFTLLQKQKAGSTIDLSLVEAFMLTPEFLTVEVLFNRGDVQVRKQRLLEMVLEGDWPLLKLFFEQQKQLNDLSPARRQKFIMEYINKGSETAASLLKEGNPVPTPVITAHSSNKSGGSLSNATQSGKKCCRLYIVQEGDSLWKISRRFNVEMEVLKERNQLQSNAIQPGTILKIP